MPRSDAADLRDVVTLEGELARREADLDSLLRRQAELSQLTQLATVTVTFVSPDDVTARAGERDVGFLVGLRAGWDAFLEVALVALTVAGALLPFALAAGLVLVPLALALRARGRSRTTPADRPAPAPPG